MALVFRTMQRNCSYLYNISKVGRNDARSILASGVCYQNSYFHRPLFETKQSHLIPLSRQCSTIKKSTEPDKKQGLSDSGNKQSTFQKLKQMYKDYWYVVVPVHMGTSCIWFGCFYYAVRSGVDVIGLLQTLGINEQIITHLKDSSAGYFALAFALYKLATPFRYAVTVGATTVAIRRLTTIGWIKPVPSRERLKEIYQEKKENFQDRLNESKQHYQTLKDRKRNQVMDEMKRYKEDVRKLKKKMTGKE